MGDKPQERARPRTEQEILQDAFGEVILGFQTDKKYRKKIIRALIKKNYESVID